MHSNNQGGTPEGEEVMSKKWTTIYSNSVDKTKEERELEKMWLRIVKGGKK